jgi:cardiolipin synthase A/B
MAKRFYTPGHYIRLVHSGNQYFETLCQLIDSANHTLHLQVYIFRNDDTGKMVIEHLKKAVKRGVHVLFMVDGYGSKELPSSFRAMMRGEGIRFRFFSPVRLILPFNAGRRMHQKVCVADGVKALTGGINIADKYRGNGTQKPWLDFALYIEGPLCQDLAAICMQVWTKRFRKRIGPPAVNHLLQSGGVMARIVENDWLRRKAQISASYKQRLRSANHSIFIIASYFLPSRRLLKILLRAAKRGRQVCIILSKHSDVPLIKPAMTYLYTRLLEAGVRIFEYNQSVLHAKAVVVDNRWVSIGSHNLNHLSEFISMEVNIEVLDKDFGEGFSNELSLLTKHYCDEVTLDEYKKRHSTTNKFIEWSSYKIVSISQRLLEMITRKPE